MDRSDLRRIAGAIRDTLTRAGREFANHVAGAWHRFIPLLRERGWQYAVLMRWNRPIGILLLMWPVLWALWLAGEGRPALLVVTVFVLGVVVMRSAGCVINDIADREIDPHVKRTRARPLATGEVSLREAWTLFVVLCLMAFGLVLLMNTLTVVLAFAGLALAMIYPFSKRFTHLPQAFLGAAFGWAVPMAFAAETGNVPPLAWLLFLTVMLWAIIYDTIYAMVDRDDDLRIGVKSSAILFGDLDRHVVGILQVTMLLALYLVGQQAGLGGWYLVALALGAGLFVYHQVLIHDRSRERCFRAFLHNHWFGLVIFAGIVLDYWVG